MTYDCCISFFFNKVARGLLQLQNRAGLACVVIMTDLLVLRQLFTQQADFLVLCGDDALQLQHLKCLVIKRSMLCHVCCAKLSVGTAGRSSLKTQAVPIGKLKHCQKRSLVAILDGKKATTGVHRPGCCAPVVDLDPARTPLASTSRTAARQHF